MGIPLSMDMRKRIIASYEEKQEIKEIVKNLKVGQTTVYNLINLYKETGSYAPRPQNAGRKPSLTDEDLENIRKMVKNEPDAELSVIKDTLNLRVSIPWLCNIINHKLNLRRKKKRYITANAIAKTLRLNERNGSKTKAIWT